MKNKLLLLIFAVLLISGCEKDECHCGIVVDKSHVYYNGKYEYYLEVINHCSGNAKFFNVYVPDWINTEKGMEYCDAKTW
jgi:hypothetical protein